ncbi:MAG TPA: ATP-binding protein [Spirochaetota bacterium]|nr:ATP-binding protein [Spirochaetota bacterium]
MVISVASGKGGTGKTLLSTLLFRVLKDKFKTVLFDLDVECPNAGLFFENKKLINSKDVSVKLPKVDYDKCNFCGLCEERCNFKAISIYEKKVSFFYELCKSCNRCYEVCPPKAIDSFEYNIGVINNYKVDNSDFYEGVLKIGDIRTKPLIKAVKKGFPESTPTFTIYDSPPGTTCPMVEAVIDSDYTILVTEDSPYGFSDILLAIETVKKINIPFGVVINKMLDPDNELKRHCEINNIEIIGSIKFDREIQEKYAINEDLLSIAHLREEIEKIAKKIMEIKK